MSILPKNIKEKLQAEIHQSLIHDRDGGKGTKLYYITGSTVVDILNNAFDYQWDWTVVEQWKEDSFKKFNTYSKEADGKKDSFQGKKGIWEEQPPVVHAKGVLVVRFEDDKGETHSITKTGLGSKTLVGGASEQESSYKAAATDALKKAASLLGVGLQLYRNEEEAAYFAEMNTENPWTGEELEKHGHEMEYIQNIIEEYSLDEKSFSAIFDDSKLKIKYFADIIPENIESVVEFIKAQISTEGKEEKDKVEA